VAKLDNPAGRLYELLSAYRAVATDQRLIIDCWAEVFEVETRTAALLRIAETAGLIPDIEAAVERSGHEEQVELFRDFVGRWVAGIVFPENNLYAKPSSALSAAVSPQNLRVLGGLSSFLSATASEGPVPSPEEVAGLHQQVIALIDEIVYDEALPEDIKRMALDHAYRLAEALDHFRIGGPGAVKAATERLAGAWGMAPEVVKKSSIWQRVFAVAGVIYAAFNKGPEVQQSLEAWTGIAGELLSGGD
jgi:hypothetical protein